MEERRQYQINNIGGFYKVFPIEDKGENLSGGLFKNSISKKAKSYYSKFERNGNVAIAQSQSAIMSSVMKSRKIGPQNQQQLIQSQQQQQSQSISQSANHQLSQLVQQQQQPYSHQQVQLVINNVNSTPLSIGSYAGIQKNTALSQSPSAFKLRNSPSKTGLPNDFHKQQLFNLPLDVAQVVPQLYKDTKGYGTQSFGGQLVLVPQNEQSRQIIDSLDKLGQSKNNERANAWVHRMRFVIGQSANQGGQLKNQQNANNSQLSNMVINVGLGNQTSNEISKAQFKRQTSTPDQKDGLSAQNAQNAPLIAQMKQQQQLKRKNFSPSAGVNVKNSSFDIEVPMLAHIAQSQSKQGVYNDTKNVLTGANKINNFSKQANQVQKTSSITQPSTQPNSQVVNTLTNNVSENVNGTINDTALSNQSAVNGPSQLSKKSKINQTKQENDSAMSMQAVKQIKAEAFKSYISQATQIQQKIIEQNYATKIEDAGGFAVQANINEQEMNFSEKEKQDNTEEKGNSPGMHKKNLSRTSARFQSNKNTETPQLQSPQSKEKSNGSIFPTYAHQTFSQKPTGDGSELGLIKIQNNNEQIKARSSKEKSNTHLPEVPNLPNSSHSNSQVCQPINQRGQPMSQQYISSQLIQQVQQQQNKRRSDISLSHLPVQQQNQQFYPQNAQMLSQQNLINLAHGNLNQDLKLPDATGVKNISANSSLMNQQSLQQQIALHQKRNGVLNPFNDYSNQNQNSQKYDRMQVQQTHLYSTSQSDVIQLPSNYKNKPIKLVNQEHDDQKYNQQSPSAINAQIANINSKAMAGLQQQRLSANAKFQHIQNAQWSQRSGSLQQTINGDQTGFQRDANDLIEEQKHLQQQINFQKSWGNGQNQSATSINNQQAFPRKSNSMSQAYNAVSQPSEQSAPFPSIQKGSIQMSQMQPTNQVQNQVPVIFQQNHYHFNSGTGQPLIVLVSSPKQRVNQNKEGHFTSGDNMTQMNQMARFMQEQQTRQQTLVSLSHRPDTKIGTSENKNAQHMHSKSFQMKQQQDNQKQNHYTIQLNAGDENAILNANGSQQSLRKQNNMQTPQQKQIINHPSTLN